MKVIISDDITNSQPIVNDSSEEATNTENTSSNDTIQSEPEETINFIPKIVPVIGSDSNETFIFTSVHVLYNGVKYASAFGQNNGVDCYAIILNSKYLFFEVTDFENQKYNVLYRYNIETNELTNLNQSLAAHTALYSIENNIFVFSLDDEAIFQYDVDLNNKSLFFNTENYSFNHYISTGFVLTEKHTKIDYILDFSGNLSLK